MSLDWFKLLNAAAIVASGVLNLYLFVKAKTDKRFEDTNARVDELEDALSSAVTERKAHQAELHTRVSVLESQVEDLPTHNDLDKIRAELTSIRTSVATVEERSKIQLDGMRRIENHLLER